MKALAKGVDGYPCTQEFKPWILLLQDFVFAVQSLKSLHINRSSKCCASNPEPFINPGSNDETFKSHFLENDEDFFLAWIRRTHASILHKLTTQPAQQLLQPKP